MKTKIYKCILMLFAIFSTGLGYGQVNHLVISQVYGGGGNTGAPYNSDFVEVFNPTGSSVSLSGWSVQYASATGTTWTAANLSGSIPAGGYYLVKMAGGAVGAALPTADLTNTGINMSGTAGKVILSNSTTALSGSCPSGASIIDLVGYGTTANCSETAVTSAPSNTTAVKRANNGCTDAGNNSTDFSVVTPTPRNSASSAVYCYPTKLVITSISPTSPTAGSGFNVTVVAQDAGSNANNVIATTAFTLSTNGNAGTISGTTTGSITAGTNSVTISGVILSSAGTGVTLTATRTSGDNLTAGTSSTFTVGSAGGTPTKFVITSISPSSPTAGAGFNVTVQAQDAGNIAQNVSATTAFSLSTNGNAGTIGGTTTGSIAAGSNSVTISGVTLSAGGTGVTLTATGTSGDPLSAGTSSTFTVVAPTKFVITSITPTSPIAGSGFSVTVQTQDAGNTPQNVAATTAFSLSTNGNAGTIGGTTTGSITAGTNSVTVTGVTLSTGGTGVTLTATRTSGDNLTAGTSSTFSVTGVATQLAFVGFPSTGTTSSVAQFTVEARRADNSVDVNYTGNVTLSKASGSGSLTGTTTVAAVAGVATFNAIQFDQAGTYTLNANSGSLTQATSSSIAITQSPLAWNFATVSPSSGTPYANLTVSDITVANNNSATALLTTTSASTGYTGASGGNNAGVAPANGALSTTSSTYFEFTLTPSAGNYVSLTAMSFGTRSTTTGAAAYSIRSSKDNYATDIATGTIATNSVWSLKNPSFSPVLSGTGTPITFRLYGYNGSGASNTVVWRIDDVTLTVDVQPCSVPTAFNVTGGGLVCGATGVAVGLSSSQSGFSYQLLKDGVNTGTPVTGTGSAISFGLQTAAGAYTIVATNPVGSCTATMTGSATVTVGTVPTVNASANNSTICAGATASLTATGASTYTWMPGSLSGSTVDVTPSSTTTYTVTGTHASGCTNTATVAITLNTLPTVGASASPTAICVGSSASLTGTGASTYSWMPGSLSGTSVSVSPSSTTTYTVTGTDVNGCVNTATVSLAVNALPNVSASADNATICAGSTANLTGTGASTYSWMPGSLSGTSVSVSPSSTTTYTVTGTDVNGCVNTSTLAITVNSLPAVGVSSTSSTICAGNSVNLNATGGTTYSWMPGSLSGASVTVSPSSTTTYTVTGTDANGCANTATVSITVNAAPPVSASTTNATLCNGNSTTLDATGANSYNWMPGSLSGASVTVSPSASTTYTVTGSDLNGCTATATVAITVNAVPTVGASSNNSSICSGNTVTLTGTGATSYNWMPGNLSGTSVSVTPSATTTYTVTGTSNGCSNTATVSVTVNQCGVSQLDISSCGITLTALNQTLGYTATPGATNYRVEFSDPSQPFTTVYVRTNSLTNLPLSQVAGLQYGRTYSVRVAAYVGGTWGLYGNTCTVTAPAVAPTTQLVAGSCGVTVTSLTQQLSFNSVPGASNYRVEVTGSSPSFSYVFARGDANTFFSLSQIPGLQYGKTYNVRVAPYVGGIWEAYGSTCTVSTPGATPTTQLTAGSCGVTVSSFAQQLTFTAISGSSNYRIELTEATQPFSYVFTRGDANAFFSLSQIPGIQYGRTYSVRIAPYIGGVWEAYGSTCTVSTPANIPTTQLASGSCGVTLTSLTQQLSYTAVSGASNYRVEVSDPNQPLTTVFVRGNSLTTFQMSQVSGVVAGRTYSVRVAAYVGGVWASYGSTCTVTTPAAAFVTNPSLTNVNVKLAADGQEITEVHENRFDLYPNPNEGTFTIALSQETQIAIYNSLGQLVLDAKMNVGANGIDLSNQPAGVYYVRINDNSGNQVFKMIKQ